MKNTLSITKNDICSCVDSVADGTNSIFVAVDVGNVVNPQCKVWLNDTLKSTVELITNEVNYVNLPPDLFTANGIIKFQYSDEIYTGQTFTINFPSDLSGNLAVNKISDYVFNAKYTKPNSGGSSYELPVMTRETLGGAKVGDNMAITADGHLYAEITPTESITNLEIDAICTLE